MKKLTHLNEQGRAKMVDISEKEETVRTAHAISSILVSKEVYEKITSSQVKKGDVLSVAQVAGIMAAKRTADIIPMCHPIALKAVDIQFEWKCDENKYELMIHSFVKTKGSTGVEMEALTAASVCALTVYDMCKAIDKGMVIGQTYLMEKTGGKNGDFRREL
ncbi:cyclic pyranopterin monophosphate synthase MoaC [Aeribacillus pallidus]|uniref:cyclic pyranopterin monophosphate synthase MoaC n=1 Tax=Aeribacillus TaxID=1055323 RepID=UPI0007B47B0B|nr:MULTISPECIES: cyclic pyranopterin monophosphate synthase MoaC [Aeribacillus]KZM55638.1 cyclic pyranopterin monophosphate synthase accessory protein [Aeribacillus pallidus]MED0651066.1 cyclic pyranopterin monophosphate synthase MoaC [Aeribacillus composti]MED0716033.1 cyclic pyranopterin monophosphate synthase MoaC [Aeribacillus composti]MED0745897.1 cyclic pyranopterin monophosphate synthase MoaC [Aeribacillus composti]MED4487652.1 cyclic pyranopterin monophosphate synthase MoaC [Aeribacill